MILSGAGKAIVNKSQNILNHLLSRVYYHKLIRINFVVALFSSFILVPSPIWGQHFTSIKSAEGIEISENGKKVLFYQVRPKSVDGKYERAGYVHPLYSLNEKILTDDMPADHPYHRGIFWAWHQIILNEKNLAEGWTSEHISWKVKEVNIKERKNGIQLQSEVMWNAELEPDKPTAIVREKTEITVFKSTPQYRILDFNIHLFALKNHLKIGGSNDAKGYGGFCLRLRLPKDLTFISGNRVVTPEETQVLAGPWMDFVGSFEGDSLPKEGVTVFGYTSGSDQQHPWILRKVTSMQNVPYPGRTPVELPKKGLRLAYRIIVHNGEMKNEEIEKLYEQYQNIRKKSSGINKL